METLCDVRAWPERVVHGRFEVIDLQHLDSNEDNYDLLQMVDLPVNWEHQRPEFIECHPARMLHIDKRIYTIYESEEEQWSLTSSEMI